VTEPQATFSPCFGGPFLVWHPNRYAELLAEKIHQHNAQVWLVNTGWTGGPAGVGSRIKLPFTRAIIDGIHSGALRTAPRRAEPIFDVEVITACPGVPEELLSPRRVWSDPAAYETAAKHLAGLFAENYQQFQAGGAPHGSMDG
jgi:phosphoenolpyruvate carboxykinase (ATP)